MSTLLRRWIHRSLALTDRWRWSLMHRASEDQTLHRDPLRLTLLERRLLMSATPIDPAALAALNPESGATAEVAVILDEGSGHFGERHVRSGAETLEESQRYSAIAFLDSTIPDLEFALHDLEGQSSGIERFVLEPHEDGIEQISKILSSRSDLDSVHFITHAEGDRIRLGNLFLGANNLNAYAGKIASWGGALRPGGDLVFYGCDLAASDSGREMLESIAALTSADVAASTDDTGHHDQGADWDFEYQLGSVDDRSVFSEHFETQWRSKLSLISVTTTSNVNDTGSTSFDITDLLNDAGSDGEVSLVEAIIAANNTIGTDTILFDLAGASPHIIDVDASLPEITDTIIIDGTFQSGYSDRPLIFLNGLDRDQHGLVLDSDSDDSTIRAIGFLNFGDNAIEVHSSGNSIVGNWIGGLDPISGSHDPISHNGASGIYVTSSDNVIGGLDRSDRNVIGGNDEWAILLNDSDATDNWIVGNWIGITPDGGADAPIGFDGIAAFDDADDNTIELNLIGNARHGIHLNDSSSNVVVSNAIGTDFSGTRPMGNSQKGIRIAGNSDDNDIGRFDRGNLIVGNGRDGVAVLDTSTGNTIRYNEITGNGELPIDLDGDGQDTNDFMDLDSGGNNRQNSPQLSDAIISADDRLSVNLALQTESFQTYRVDFYKASADPGTLGDPVTYLGYSIVSTSASGYVNVVPTGVNLGIDAGDQIVATATSLDGSTSEFSTTTPVVLVNAAPVVDGIEPQPLQYIENSGTVAVSPWIRVSDADSQPLQSASVSIDGYQANEDRLAYAGVGGIVGSWDAASGVLTLTGSASAADYQVALRSVTFENTSDRPNTTPRTIRFSVFDGAESSLVASRGLVVIPQQDPTTGAPVLPYMVTEDQAITADTSSIDDLDGLGAFTYRWFSGGTLIPNATTDTFTPDDQHVGDPLSVSVSFVDGLGNSVTLNSAPTGDVINRDDLPTGAPMIIGNAIEDATLLADTSTIDDVDGMSTPNFQYQWMRDGVAIAGATEDSYVLGANDVNTRIAVTVSFADDPGTIYQITSGETGPVVAVDHPASGTPVIAGSAVEDETLFASVIGLSDPDGLSAPQFRFQWHRDGNAVTGATSQGYSLDDFDVGASFYVDVTLTDDRGNETTLRSSTVGPVSNVNDLPDGLPIITGTYVEEQTLTADLSAIRDDDGTPGTATFQWLRDGNEIGGATDRTYQLTLDDVGQQLSVRVEYVDLQGTKETVVSNPTPVIDNLNDAPTLKDRTRKIEAGETLNVGKGLFRRASDDADGDTLQAVLVAPPDNGTFELNSNGSFKFTPDPDFFGTVTFTWQADDGEALSNEATVTIVVSPPNNVPGVSTGPATESTGDPAESESSTESGTSTGSDPETPSSGGDSIGPNTPVNGVPTGPGESVDNDSSAAINTDPRDQSRLVGFQYKSQSQESRLIQYSSLDDRAREVDGLDSADSAVRIARLESLSLPPIGPGDWADYALPGTPDEMLAQLDVNQDRLEKLLESEQLLVGSFGAATGGFAVVALAWLRNGFLVLGLWQQRPLWSRMDPLVLMQGLRSKNDESLEDVIADQRRKLEQDNDHDRTE